MKRMFGLSLVLGLFIILMIISCNKTVNTDGTDQSLKAPDTCRPVKMIISEYYIKDTADFIYQNDRIVRVNYRKFYKTLAYKDSLVTRVNYHNYNSPAVVYYQDIVYNSAGRIDSTVASGVNPWSTAHGVYGYAFFYNADGTPRRIESYNFGLNGFESNYACDYTYTDKNIPTVKLYNYGSISDIKYTYDTSANFLTKLPAEFVFADEYYFSFTTPLQMNAKPQFFTKNNMISQDGRPITYKTDSNGYMIEYNSKDFHFAKFIYECP